MPSLHFAASAPRRARRARGARALPPPSLSLSHSRALTPRRPLAAGAALALSRAHAQEEITVLQSNFSSLRSAQSKFAASEAAVEAYAAEASAAGGARDALVPLTSSLYVPARLAADAELLVDIGTGFFVGKRAAEAREVLLKKAALLKANTDSLQKILQQ